jgi:hypothetical protein
LTHSAAIVAVCLAWACFLGATLIWPHWNRTHTLRVQARDLQSQVAVLEARLESIRGTADSDSDWRARDRALSQEDLPGFMRDIRVRAGAMGATVVRLDWTQAPAVAGQAAPVLAKGHLAAQGSFEDLYRLLHDLEHRRVFVAVTRADLTPLSAGGGLKAVYDFEFLVVPATAKTGGEGKR